MDGTRSLIGLRGLLAIALLVAAPLACGRTDLDEPGGLDETGAGTGSGGTTAGQGGASAGSGGSTATGGASGRGGAGGATGGTRGGSGGLATSGSGGIAGGTGGAGRGGAGGTPPTPIPCGMMTCAPSAQSCCVGRGGAASCIPASSVCMGASISCLDTPSCGAGRVCCLGLLSASTSCTTSAACSAQTGGLVLCTSNADCNPLAPNCCTLRGVGAVCAAQTCPPGRGAPPAPPTP